MRKAFATITFFSVIIFASTTQTYAQRGMGGRGGGGWGPGSSYNRMFDTRTVETITGEVVSVETIMPMRGMSNGIHLVLRTNTGTISVHVGPAWYIENQDVKILSKDRIEVKGSRVTFQGKPTIIASEIRRGDKILRLRDANGFPLWSGWRHN